MSTINLAALQIFKTVAEEGGITRAASKLHRVQSNVTTRIKQLEEQLGTSLFLRQNRKLVLSAEGRLLLDYADRMLRLSFEAESVLRRGTPRGTFRLGTMESTAACRLPPILSRYHLAYPEVTIELSTGTSGALLQRLRNFETEAAFVGDPFAAAKDLDMQTAFKEKLVLIAPRNFPKIKSAKDLVGATVIAFSAGCSYRRRLEDWLSATEVILQRVMAIASYHALIACVAAGAGIAIAPKATIDAVRVGRELAIYPLPARIANTTTWLVWRAGHRSGALDALKKQLSAA
ncbi:MAG: LysR family transcriptional regulator [Betaproteobacteria bacterium]|nr:LysR family transcriptional regulator [Betaproteobacteria bacterium]